MTGKEYTGEKDLAYVDDCILGDEDEALDIGYVVAREVGNVTKDESRGPGNGQATEGGKEGYHSLPSQAVDEVQRRCQNQC